MSVLRRLLLRLYNVIRPGRAERQLAREVDSHLAMLKLVGAGLIVGVAASLATNRLLVSQLWNTSPNDPTTFGAVMAAILAIGVLACWIPARRAVRVEPMVALRHD